METKHTQGPWTNEYGRIRQGLHGRVIATTSDENHPENPANAKLIAEAPAMAELIADIARPAGTVDGWIADARAIMARLAVVLALVALTGCSDELARTPSKATAPTATGVAHVTFTATNSQAETVTLSLERVPYVDPAGPTIDILFTTSVDQLIVRKDGMVFDTRIDRYADADTGRGGMRYWRISVKGDEPDAVYNVEVAYKGLWFKLDPITTGRLTNCGVCKELQAATPPPVVQPPTLTPATCSRDALDVAWSDSPDAVDKETVTVGLKPGYTGSVSGYMTAYGVGADGGRTIIHGPEVFTMPGTWTMHWTHGLYPHGVATVTCADGSVLSATQGVW